MSAERLPVVEGRETAITFECAGHRLLGIASWPAAGHAPAAPTLGVLIVVGGPQYRAGSHRQFVHLARAFAAADLPTLRFDCRGMGDSEGEPRTFEEMDDDIGSAITALCAAAPSLQRVVLCALCDGASASLLYLRRRGPDARVAGLVLMNPWVRTDSVQAETRVRHYYRERLLDPTFWRKLLSGGVARGALRDALASVKTALTARRSAGKTGASGAPQFIRLMAEGCLRFAGPKLFVISGRDYTAKEFLLTCEASPAWREAMSSVKTSRVDLPSADHTFSSSHDERDLHREVLEWLRKLPAPPPA